MNKWVSKHVGVEEDLQLLNFLVNKKDDKIIERFG